MNFFIPILFSFISFSENNLPVHCEWGPQMKGIFFIDLTLSGTWTFHLTDNTHEKDVVGDCPYNKDVPFPITKTMKITLKEPNIAINEDTKEQGNFTLVCDEDLFVKVSGIQFLAFFKFVHDGDVFHSYCNETFTGWFHDIKTDYKDFPKNWGCFRGEMESYSNENVFTSYKINEKVHKIPIIEEVDVINKKQNLWKAKKYPDETYQKIFESLSKNKKPRFRSSRKKVVKTNYVDDIPDQWDWRNVSGKNYVSKVTQQTGGDSWAWTSSGMYESRARVQSDLSFQPVYLTNELVVYSAYNQGKQGGYPFAADIWVEDFSLIFTKPTGENEGRSFVKDSEYVGGYYGGCDEKGMLDAAYNGGPNVVCFWIYEDLYNYESGIYHHQEDEDSKVNWESTNHAVLLVGWGVQNGTKYWIMKNCWGDEWGMNGYFWIIRGIDNCAIESEASYATVVLD